MDPLCSDQQIRDQFVLHEKCAQCSVCRCPLLEGRCFERDGRLFCQVHYAELICSVPPPTTFCAGCHCRLEASDLVYKLKANIFYHVRCHRCAKCGRQLAQGEQIVVDERSRAVACAQHFLPTESHEAPFGPTTRLNNDDGAQLHQFDQQQKLPSQFPQNACLEGCNTLLGNIGRGMSFDQQMPSASFEDIRANTSNAIDPCTAPEFGLAMAMGDELLREAQIEQELATVRRLTQMMADSQQQLDGINAQQHYHQALQQSPTCDFEFAVMMADSVVPSRGKGGDTGTEGGIGIGTLLTPGQIRHHDGHQSIAARDGMVASCSADDAVEFEAEIVQRIMENEQQGKADANGKSRKLSHHQTTPKGSPSPASKCPAPSSQTQLDGHVLSSTLNTIKATVSGQERPKESVRDGHQKKKKSKADAAAAGVGGGIGRRTSSCSSTPVPVPQYPFEMYAAGEQFSRQEEEFQSGQGNKRRGPRTTISQQQLDILNDIFAKTPKPSKHARAKLAVDAGLSMRVIQVWFQNRRSKERRLKHLCNFLRHCDGQGPAVKEEQAAEEEAEATLLMRMAVKEERSEFDPDPE